MFGYIDWVRYCPSHLSLPTGRIRQEPLHSTYNMGDWGFWAQAGENPVGGMIMISAWLSAVFEFKG